MKNILISLVAAISLVVCIHAGRAAEFQALDSLAKAHYGATHVTTFDYTDLQERGTNATWSFTNSIGRVGQGIEGVALMITVPFTTTNALNTNLTFIAGMQTNTALYFASAPLGSTTNARVRYGTGTRQLVLVRATNVMTVATDGVGTGLISYTAGAARVYFKILDPLAP